MKLKIPPTLTTLLASGTLFLLPVFTCAGNPFTGPNGTWTVQGLGPTNAVWDVSSVPRMTNIHIFTTNRFTLVQVDCPIGPATQNGGGKIAGAGSSTAAMTLVDDTGVDHQSFAVEYSLKGGIAGGRGKARGTLTESLSGMADIEGMRRVKAAHSIKFVIDSVGGTISGSHGDRASAAGKGSISSHKTVGPEGLDDYFAGNGSWTLEMTLATTNKTVTGTATVTLNSGRVFNYTIKGSYNTTTQQSRLTLKGIDSAKGSVLQARMDAAVVTLVKGKISGQAVNVVNPPDRL